jgi:hypothetical protein
MPALSRTQRSTISASASGSRDAIAVTLPSRPASAGLAVEQRRLHDLAEPRAVLGLGQRRERPRVGEDGRGLVEGPREVLPGREVDRRLAADRGVDLGESVVGTWTTAIPRM